MHCRPRRLTNLLMDLDLIRDRSASAEKLTAGIAEFETYIRNNQESIPNYGERYRQGETISTAFVESPIKQLVSRRFVKKQQMHWTLRGAHLLLQTRTKVLNDELEEVFRRWYPLFRVQAKAACPPGFLMLSFSSRTSAHNLVVSHGIRVANAEIPTRRPLIPTGL